MKIVLLDGHTINPGDLSWKKLEDLCDEFTVYERTPPELIEERMADCDVLMTSKCQISRELMENAPKLKFIGSTATGYNNIDVAAASDLGIAVTNIPAYSTDAVAQHTIALMLELTNRVGDHNASVQSGEWSRCEHFCYWKHPVTLLAGRTLGIIGYGSIGHRVAEIAGALGMDINIYSRDREAAVGSDVVTLHCPLTAENAKMINRDFIASMMMLVRTISITPTAIIVRRMHTATSIVASPGSKIIPMKIGTQESTHSRTPMTIYLRWVGLYLSIRSRTIPSTP